MKISKKELNRIFIQERKRLDRDYRRMFKRVARQKSSALNEAYSPQNIRGGPPYEQNPNRGMGSPEDMVSRYSEGDDDSEEDDELTDAYTIGPYGIIALEGLRKVILQEMKMMEEGMFDFLGSLTPGRWKDASGMEHDDMGGGPGPVPLDRAAHDLAVALANRIESYAAGWSGPESGGATADYERAGWHRIADSTGQGHWDAVLHAVGPATADQAKAVLNQWERDGYIVRTEPDILGIDGIGRASGIWLRWSGYQAMKRLRDESAQSASMQYTY